MRLMKEAQATMVARMAHDGLARTIRPIHTPFDGDTVFVMSTRTRGIEGDPSVAIAKLGTLAADVVAAAASSTA